MSTPDPNAVTLVKNKRGGLSTGKGPLTWAAQTAAIVVILAWLALNGYMLSQTRVTDAEWTRLAAILASVEAVAFAAAGALWGTAVQKGRVDDAKQRADKAEKAASAGKTLAGAVNNHLAGSAQLAAPDPQQAELLKLAQAVMQA